MCRRTFEVPSGTAAGPLGLSSRVSRPRLLTAIRLAHRTGRIHDALAAEQLEPEVRPDRMAA